MRVREGRPREIVTPEGVPLRLTLATVGDRIAAFLLDLLIIAAVAIGIVIAFFIFVTKTGFGEDAETGIAIFVALGLLALFLIRNFYFAWFEVRWNGTTPGKRALGLRVVDAHGGVLSAEAVLARNLVRDLEVFLPIVALMSPEALWAEGPGWMRLLAGGWLVAIALVPALNRDRLRVGDLIAGTLVVVAPKTVLLRDLGAVAAAGPLPPAKRGDREAETTAATAAGPRYTFTPEQLDIYGIYELQVLEDLLRQPRPEPDALRLVCEKIQKKIAWSGGGTRHPAERHAFLRDFYAAQRARLEAKLLLGERKERKGR
jgi:uncharacterized RDD family membrane protein YckC